MLARSTYPQEYIDACRDRIAARVTAYAALETAATSAAEDAAAGRTGSGAWSIVAPALAKFEGLYFNDLLVVLDAFFVHRTRAVEGKDGNPLNETRLIVGSVLEHDAVFTADSTIRYDTDASILGLQAGARIALTKRQFVLLAAAFFNELEQRFAE